MNILINNGDPEEYLIRNKILWELTMKRPYFASLVLLALGIIILVVGLFQPYSFSSDIGKGTSYYNFHFSIGLGSGLILLALLYLRTLQKTKTDFNETINLHIQRAKAVNNYKSTIAITADTITFSNFEETIQTNWSAFIYYKIVKNHVVLYKQKSRASYLIDLSKMNQKDQVEFTNLLSKKIG